MKTLLSILVLTSIVLSSAASAQRPSERVKVEGGTLLAPPADLRALISEASAVVLARFEQASGEVKRNERGEPQALLGHLHFTVIQPIKPHPQLPVAGNAVQVIEARGEFVNSNPPVVTKLGPLAQALKAGHTYVLFLHWDGHFEWFSMPYGRGAAFDVSGNFVVPLDDTSLAKQHAGSSKDNFVKLIQSSLVR